MGRDRWTEGTSLLRNEDRQPLSPTVKISSDSAQHTRIESHCFPAPIGRLETPKIHHFSVLYVFPGDVLHAPHHIHLMAS